jgi:hypothetical protein
LQYLETISLGLIAQQKGVAMNVVYNSENYAIVAYPVQQGFELVDKLGGRSLFVQGSVATGLREAIDRIPYTERNEESIDSLLDDYCVGAARPIVYH